MGILSGWDYHFRGQPAANAQRTAQRATLDRFQAYPNNTIQGAGTLTSQYGTAGKYFAITQPPQVVVNHAVAIASLTAGGTRTVGLYSRSLVDNNNSSPGF